ncbi:hypothetical protein ABZ357_05425 [Streptomyces sp. NPDC005917]|uniref:hypothetical protein n=1 Tax=unclassified Streptomyces TaxID=2593676 RepID=UPI0033EFBC42
MTVTPLHTTLRRYVDDGTVRGAVGLVARGDDVEVVTVGAMEAAGSAPMAREAKPNAAASIPTPKPSPSMSTMGSITIKASKTSVKAGETVTFTGRTKGLKIGTQLVLQHQNGGKWIPLKVSAKVKNGSAYSLTAKLNTKGTSICGSRPARSTPPRSPSR